MTPRSSSSNALLRLHAEQSPAWNVVCGVTNDLARRVHEHKTKAHHGFTSRYDVHRLIWYETYERIDEALSREKALKKWRRDWKIVLIEEFNPDWNDLYRTLAG